MWRPIKLRILLSGGLCYRCFIICCNTLFFLFGIKATGVVGNVSWWTALKMALGTSLVWNLINTGLYFVFHYTFTRMFKYGSERGK